MAGAPNLLHWQVALIPTALANFEVLDKIPNCMATPATIYGFGQDSEGGQFHGQ
jgi:hypothetical protein